MASFSDQSYAGVYAQADLIRKVIFAEESGFVWLPDFFSGTDNPNFVAKVAKPHRTTLLHDFIETHLQQEMDYELSKVGAEESFIEYYEEFLEQWQVFYPKVEHHLPWSSVDAAKNWSYQLWGYFSDAALGAFTNAVFSILYGDRAFLAKFNELAARGVRDLKMANHPEILQHDGTLSRPYWPKDLLRAVANRDRVKCAVCLRDLSDVIAINSPESRIDHIVPLNLGGTNDPTNLQLLCEPCNQEKGGHTIHTGRFYQVYWDTEGDPKDWT